MQASVSPEFRAADFYGSEQAAPEDVPTLDRLAAFTGRSCNRHAPVPVLARGLMVDRLSLVPSGEPE